jgi:hypothetical protein
MKSIPNKRTWSDNSSFYKFSTPNFYRSVCTKSWNLSIRIIIFVFLSIIVIFHWLTMLYCLFWLWFFVLSFSGTWLVLWCLTPLLTILMEETGAPRENHRPVVNSLANFITQCCAPRPDGVNATFNNISVISWRSVLLVEETEVHGENHRFVCRKSLTNFITYCCIENTSPWTCFHFRRCNMFSKGN